MKKLGIGVLGVGEMGKRHAENVRHLVPGAELVAVGDVAGARAKQVAEELEVAKSFGSLEAMLECKEVQAVLIATPDKFHAQGVLEAAKAGKDILCEKPIALTLADAYAALANGGTLYEPQLVEKVETPAGEVLQQFHPIVQGHLEAGPANLALVRKGLVAVVRNGTGQRAYLDNVEVAGKTGTSQVVSLEREKADKQVRKYRNHAWFVAYAPAGDPEVVVSVIIEHGGQGGEVAAPLARRFLASYFSKSQVAREGKPDTGE